MKYILCSLNAIFNSLALINRGKDYMLGVYHLLLFGMDP